MFSQIFSKKVEDEVLEVLGTDLIPPPAVSVPKVASVSKPMPKPRLKKKAQRERRR